MTAIGYVGWAGRAAGVYVCSMNLVNCRSFHVDEVIVRTGNRTLEIGELLLQGCNLDGYQR